MTKIVYDLILKLEQCDDFHNRCDYLMEHSEITELLEYINNLQQENKQLKKEKDALYNALITTRTKYNNDKARYRRKAKRYRNILTELEKWLKETRINSSFIDELTLMEVQLKIQELKEKYK